MEQGKPSEQPKAEAGSATQEASVAGPPKAPGSARAQASYRLAEQPIVVGSDDFNHGAAYGIMGGLLFFILALRMAKGHLAESFVDIFGIREYRTGDWAIFPIMHWGHVIGATALACMVIFVERASPIDYLAGAVASFAALNAIGFAWAALVGRLPLSTLVSLIFVIALHAVALAAAPILAALVIAWNVAIFIFSLFD